MLIFDIFLNSLAHISSSFLDQGLIKDVSVSLVMSQPGLWSNSMHFQVLVLTSSIGKSKTLYWQVFSYAGDSIHEAFFHRGSVSLESTVADALE